MTTTSAIVSDINTFIAATNQYRGGALAGGGNLPIDYNELTGSVPSGGNAVTGIAGIASGAASIALPSTSIGNAVIVDGAVSLTASTSGTDSYSFSVNTSGVITITDNNTGNSQTVTGASYLVFDGGATTSSGAYESIYMIETDTNAQIASLYNAALGRLPDLAGLEYYAIPIASGAMTLQQAAADFMNSPEFQSRFSAAAQPADNGGVNDQAFVTALYANVLHRTPNSSELGYYVAALQNSEAGSIVNTTNSIAWSRAQELINFSLSPENQSDIGGWLINPANGTTSFGAFNAQATLTSEAASGTVNAADFSSMNQTSLTSVATSTGFIGVVGAEYVPTGSNSGAGYGQISISASKITVDLSSTYNYASISGVSDTVNSLSTGGSTVDVRLDTNGGTVNLFGNGNVIFSGFYTNTGITVPTVVNGWNATDLIGDGGGKTTSTVYQASTSSPISGASIYNSSYRGQQIAIDVGSISDGSASTIAAAANTVYKVSNSAFENIFFFGQDTKGNTFVYHWEWHGDTTSAHQVLLSDLDGAVELVGVSASSLTSANFH